MNEPSITLRRLLLWLLLLGLTGVATELTFLRHYDDTWMLIPFGAIAVAAVRALSLIHI